MPRTLRHRTVGCVSAPRSEPVYRITAAGTSLSEEQRGRQRRYLISMLLRTACFVAAILVEGPVRWVLIVAALVLPYLAVVIANSGRAGADPAPPVVVLQPDRRQLGPTDDRDPPTP